MIPNIIHFIFGLKKQTDEFLFVYYVAILSAKLVNNPDKIYLYYHYPPFGEWWEKTKNLCELVKINIPEFIGDNKIIETAHKADIIRMNKLYEIGGIYLDIDTICIKPFTELLKYNCILGEELNKFGHKGICNAIMLTEPKSEFFKLWLDKYEEHFNPKGWGESSIILPYQLYNNNKELVHLLKPEAFFIPSYFQTKEIFRRNYNIPPNLFALHLWESHSYRFFKSIRSFDWCNEKYKHTLYGRILKYLDTTYNISKYCI
jgi:hypothetical protein